MIFALSTIISMAAVLQTHLSDIYLIATPPQLIYMSPEELADRLIAAWRTDGIAVVLSTFGIWTIKMNFMLFFYRFGRQPKAYATLWWVAMVVIVACGAVQFGVIPYSCLFADLTYMQDHCGSKSTKGYIYSAYKVNVAVDVLSDFISKLSNSASISLVIGIDHSIEVTDARERRSHYVSRFYLVEYQDLNASEAYSVEHILTGCSYYSRDYSPWRYL